MRCHIDIETFSTVNLKQTGVYPYAAHLSTEVLCLAYGIDDNPVRLWVVENELPPNFIRVDEEEWHWLRGVMHVGMDMPEDLRNALDIAELHAFNAQFERTVLNGPFARALGVPPTGIERWHCTQAEAAVSALPQNLKMAAKALGVKHQKDEAGRGVMQQLSKPRKPSTNNSDDRWTLFKYPEKYRVLYSYCIDDVKAERDVSRATPDLSEWERRTWVMDQEINDRGVQVDLDAAAALTRVREERKDEIRERFADITGGVKPGSTVAVREWLADESHRGTHRVVMPDMIASSVEHAIAGIGNVLDKCEDPAGKLRLSENKEVLELYSAYQMKAPSKLDAMRRASLGGRLRGMFRWHGAGPGRWSSHIVQLQNLKRPEHGVDPEQVIELVAGGASTAWLGCLYGEVMALLASCIRSMVTAAPGKVLVWADFAQIEARVLSWLAGSKSRLAVFASGEDMYTHTASTMFGRPASDIAKDSEERFLGKTAELALGYQGGVKAFVKMAENFGASIPEDRAEEIKNAWRETNPEIAGHENGFWVSMERAAAAAVKNHGSVYSVSDRRIRFKVDGRWLLMRLPSGRRIRYLDPEVGDDGLTYMGIDTYTRQWTRCQTYGGKLTENVVQGLSFDLQAEAMLKMRDRGLDLVAHVHDEAICESDERVAQEVHDAMMECMLDLPPWATGLPVAAEGVIAKRYRK